MTGDTTDAARARAEYEAAMTTADIPKLYWRKALPQLGLTGTSLRTYLQHGAYTEDRNSGVGLYLWGKNRARAAALPVLGRELVLLGDHVQYVSMRKFVHVVNGGGEDYDIVMRCDALCIGQFFDDSVPCPYSGPELSNAEDFLRRRFENEQRVYLSSSSDVRSAVWYPAEFRNLIALCTKEFNFGD